ncbi:MAG: hypothetical protein HKM94_01425 [Halobacteria archaeon]|nr:hypothetical protein [Halobacteria archaeon]
MARDSSGADRWKWLARALIGTLHETVAEGRGSIGRLKRCMDRSSLTPLIFVEAGSIDSDTIDHTFGPA